MKKKTRRNSTEIIVVEHAMRHFDRKAPSCTLRTIKEIFRSHHPVFTLRGNDLSGNLTCAVQRRLCVNSQETTVEGIWQYASWDPWISPFTDPQGNKWLDGSPETWSSRWKVIEEFSRHTQVMFSSLLPVEGHVFGKERRMGWQVNSWRECWRY